MNTSNPAEINDSHPAYDVINREGTFPLVLVCEHACNHVMPEYASLGLPQSELDRHIGHDIGTLDVVYELARLLDAPAVVCKHSRLFVDCNRSPSDPTWMCEESDGVIIAGNQQLDAYEKGRRAALVFNPFHREVETLLDASRLKKVPVNLIAIHSFTPVLAGQPRPWDVGIIWRDKTLAIPLLKALQAQGNLRVGDNLPYDGTDFCGYTLERHAEAYDIPALAIEIRQDLIANKHNAQHWANVLATCIRSAMGH